MTSVFICRRERRESGLCCVDVQVRRHSKRGMEGGVSSSMRRLSRPLRRSVDVQRNSVPSSRRSSVSTSYCKNSNEQNVLPITGHLTSSSSVPCGGVRKGRRGDKEYTVPCQHSAIGGRAMSPTVDDSCTPERRQTAVSGTLAHTAPPLCPSQQVSKQCGSVAHRGPDLAKGQRALSSILPTHGVLLTAAATPEGAAGVKGYVLSLRDSVSGKKWFTPSEIALLHSQAQMEYEQKCRSLQLRSFIHEEENARMDVVVDATCQMRELQERATRGMETIMRETSLLPLPLQKLELRIKGRLTWEYHEQDMRLREEGRAAWKLETEEMEKAQVAADERNTVQRRAEKFQFGAAMTFLVVHERNLRGLLEQEVSAEWERLLGDEAADKEASDRLAHERFMNTPEQLALTAARERRDRKRQKRDARLLRLFTEQQNKFITQCHHRKDGGSLFEGPDAKVICGRCRVKLDEVVGYYVSLEKGVVIHPPPPESPTAHGELTSLPASLKLLQQSALTPKAEAPLTSTVGHSKKPVRVMSHKRKELLPSIPPKRAN